MSDKGLAIGKFLSYAGRVYEVRALAPIDDRGPAQGRRMALMALAGQPAHPFNWWPEASVLREFERAD